jgi:ribosomal protein S24E
MVLTCFIELTALPHPSSSRPQKAELTRKVANYTDISACLVGSDRVKAGAGTSAAKIVIINNFSGNTS